MRSLPSLRICCQLSRILYQSEVSDYRRFWAFHRQVAITFDCFIHLSVYVAIYIAPLEVVSSYHEVPLRPWKPSYPRESPFCMKLFLIQDILEPWIRSNMFCGCYLRGAYCTLIPWSSEWPVFQACDRTICHRDGSSAQSARCSGCQHSCPSAALRCYKSSSLFWSSKDGWCLL